MDCVSVAMVDQVPQEKKEKRLGTVQYFCGGCRQRVMGMVRRVTLFRSLPYNAKTSFGLDSSMLGTLA